MALGINTACAYCMDYHEGVCAAETQKIERRLADALAAKEKAEAALRELIGYEASPELARDRYGIRQEIRQIIEKHGVKL